MARQDSLEYKSSGCLPNTKINVNRELFCISFSAWGGYKNLFLSYHSGDEHRDMMQDPLLWLPIRRESSCYTSEQSFGLRFAGLTHTAIDNFSWYPVFCYVHFTWGISQRKHPCVSP